jgi:hypothetical protein
MIKGDDRVTMNYIQTSKASVRCEAYHVSTTYDVRVTNTGVLWCWSIPSKGLRLDLTLFWSDSLSLALERSQSRKGLKQPCYQDSLWPWELQQPTRHNMEMGRTGRVIMRFLFRVREILGSILHRVTSYSGWRVSWFSLLYPCKFCDSISNKI